MVFPMSVSWCFSGALVEHETQNSERKLNESIVLTLEISSVFDLSWVGGTRWA